MVAKYIRKIQLTGRSTYIVSLPKKWVLEHGLSRGSHVVIEDIGSYVFIRPYKPGEPREERVAVVKVTDNNAVEAITRRIIGAYIMGFDKIIVRAEGSITPALRNAVREVLISKLPGAEVVNEDRHEIHIQVLLSSRGIPLSSAIKRLAKVVQANIQDSCGLLEKGDVKLAPEIVKEDDSVDRAFFYVTRLINQIASGRTEENLAVNLVELLMYRALSKLLERIGDHAMNIALYISGLKSREDLFREVHKLCQDSLNIYSRAVEAFFNEDPYAVEEIANNVEALKKAEEHLLSSVIEALKPSELISLRMMLDSIRRIAEYSKDIGELALDAGIGKIIAQQNPPLTPK